jgi:hypothetical protein
MSAREGFARDGNGTLRLDQSSWSRREDPYTHKISSARWNRACKGSDSIDWNGIGEAFAEEWKSCELNKERRFRATETGWQLMINKRSCIEGYF